MDKVADMMIFSQLDHARTACAQVHIAFMPCDLKLTPPLQIFLSFIVEYPLGTKRLDQHLQFVVANLTYMYETGRCTALRVLNEVKLRIVYVLIMTLIAADDYQVPCVHHRAIRRLFLCTTCGAACQ